MMSVTKRIIPYKMYEYIRKLITDGVQMNTYLEAQH